MKRRVTTLLIAALLATACSNTGGETGGPPGGAAPLDEAPPAIDPYEPNIDPANFVDRIDNKYLPLEPGTTMVYRGGDGTETEVVRVTVTDRTKEVMGVTTTVVKDVAVVNGELAEKTFDWFAQDQFGNVWYFGEATVEYEDGKTDTAGSWEAGVDGALPGIVMLGSPDVGDQYRQEYYEGEAEDMGKVITLDAETVVAYGKFDDVLVTEDWTPLEQNVLENKYYAPGVGVVREEAVKGGSTVLELVSVRS